MLAGMVSKVCLILACFGKLTRTIINHYIYFDMIYLMLSKYRVYSWAVFLVLIIFLIIFFTFKERSQIQDLVADNVKNYFHKILKQKEQSLLSLAIALGENSSIKESLLEDDEQRAKELLINTANKLNKFPMLENLKLQIISKNRYLFARSWDSAFEGFPLWWFRDDMDDKKSIKKPKSGIEIGMMLTIRATVPIIKNDKSLVGYLEAIELLDHITSRLREDGIELVVLMDRRYLKEASLMRNNEVVDNFVVANSNASDNYVRMIKNIPLSKLQTRPMMIDGLFFILEPMLNSNGKLLGWFLLILPPNSYKNFTNESVGIFKFNNIFNQNLNHVVRFWQSSENLDEVYKNQSDKELIQTLPKLRDEDRVIYLQKARKILKNYNKDELIDIILKSANHTKKVGEIR